jgi:hypothetical protein
MTPAQEDFLAARMAELVRLVASTDIVGSIPEPLISPLLRAQALAMWIRQRVRHSPYQEKNMTDVTAPTRPIPIPAAEWGKGGAIAAAAAPDTKSFSGSYLLYRKTGGSLARPGQRSKARNPRFRHPTFAAAESEAVRLLEYHPESTFVVLQEIARVKLKDAAAIEPRAAERDLHPSVQTVSPAAFAKVLQICEAAQASAEVPTDAAA